MEISDLKHVSRPLPNGGQVVVLNTGAIITPEDCAMLQALYSRSPAGIGEHLEKLAKSGSGKFMETFYLGYGHNSIGDCGCAYIFIEGVSMLAAKAIQDWPLYSGQECSTRYLDFSVQPFIDPLKERFGGQHWLKDLRHFYVTHMQAVKDHVASQFPRQECEDEKMYAKAVNARAFDIMRAFLPAGASTSLSWTTNLRQAKDKLLELRHHPLEEVRVIAQALEEALTEAYPHSFPAKRYDATEAFLAEMSKKKHSFRDWAAEGKWPVDATMVDCYFHPEIRNKDSFEYYCDWFQNRPAHVEFPKDFNDLARFRFRFLLDFGSFRDIQRHRAVHQRMPLLDTYHGFESWYLEQLPIKVWAEAQKLLGRFEDWHERKRMLDHLSVYDLQYLVPMGYRIPCEVSGGLSAIAYLMELRSSPTVHPTLRRQAQKMAEEIKLQPFLIFLHVDDSEVGRFDIKRGQQDIVEK